LPPVASLKNVTEGVELEGNIDSAIVLDDSGESPYTAPVSMLYPCCSAASFCGAAALVSLESRAHMQAVKFDVPVENRRDVSVTGLGVGD